MPDLYDTLGVARDADTATIRKAYRKASKRAHPDGGGSPERFRAVSQAVEVLTDPKRRKTYDETGTVEDKPADNEEAELMALISAFLDQVLKGLDEQGVAFEKCDLIQRMKEVASKRKTELHQHAQAIKEAITKQRKLFSRFKLKGKKADMPNRMESLISGRIAWLEGQHAHAARQLELLKKAEEFLSEYKFESESQSQAATASYFYYNAGTIF